MTGTERTTSDYSINIGCLPDFVLSIIRRLNNAGFSAYLVGGAVRDILLGRPVVDWDIATSASNNEISLLFNDVRHFSLKHETLILVHKGIHYEVTTIKGNEFTDRTIEEDLGHRDFTINAMAYDPAKQVTIDPYHGNQDLKKKVIRAVRDPFERFNEDSLRLIRAIRISVELGFTVDDSTMEAITMMSPQLNLSANERIRDELMKILLVKKPSAGFRLLRKSGLLEAFLPELLEGLSKRQNHHHSYTIFRHIMETVDRVELDPVLRLAALFHDIAKPRVRQKVNGEFRFYGHAEKSALLASGIMERLRFSNEIIRKVTNLITNHMVEYGSHWSDGAVRRLIRRFMPDPIELLMSFRRADLLAHGTTGSDLYLLSELENRISALRQDPHIIHTRDLALDGEKVMEILELAPGHEVGKALDFLLENVTDHPELNNEDALIKLLKDMRSRSNYNP
jgi:tRNA nucleotidyltransferase (CCA-adding enzyme)